MNYLLSIGYSTFFLALLSGLIHYFVALWTDLHCHQIGQCCRMVYAAEDDLDE